LRLQSQLPTIDLLKDYVAKGYPNKVYSDRLKMGPLKILTDGTLGARTAAMLLPYSDDPSETGILTYPSEALYELVKTAHQAGMSVAMHAIGDAAMTQVLDAYERVLTEDPRKDHRHCIIHSQITSEAILDRMARLDVYAAVQPIFIDADMEIVWDRVGSDRARTSYAWKTMLVKGINVAFGTDAPVEDINPIENIRAAVTRTNRAGHTYLPEQAVTAQEAILAYTVASAKQTRDEHELGKIAPGYFADFAVWNRNQFVHMKSDHLEKEALLTYVGGTLVHTAKQWT
jgi:predicted amidohydrolase YtcJ